MVFALFTKLEVCEQCLNLERTFHIFISNLEKYNISTLRYTRMQRENLAQRLYIFCAGWFLIHLFLDLSTSVPHLAFNKLHKMDITNLEYMKNTLWWQCILN